MQSTVDQIEYEHMWWNQFLKFFKINELKGNVIHIFKMNNLKALTHLEKKNKNNLIAMLNLL